jgi:glycosyltransferase involved in cell wall biosynthesis
MKIVMLLTNAFKPDYRVAKEAQTLTALGHSITILAWDRSGKLPEIETKEGIEIRRCQVRSSFGGGLRQFGKFLLFYFWVFSYLLTHRFDAIHCHDLDTLPIGFLAGRLKFKDVVYDSHEPFYTMSGRQSSGRVAALTASVESHLAKRASSVIATNPWHLHKFHDLGIERVVEVANYPPCDLFSSLTPKAETDTIVFGTVAGIRPRIGLELMIDGFRLLRPDLDNVKLVIAGHCEQQDYLSYLMNQARGIDDVHFDVRNDISKVQERYEKLDVVLLLYSPSNRNYQSNTSTRLYESMAAKKPVITSDVGFTAEIVRLEKCGLILNDYSPEGLMHSMRYFCEHRSLAHTLGKRGYEAFRTKYYWEVNTESLQRVYPTATVDHVRRSSRISHA